MNLIKILLVEDNPTDVKLLRKVFSKRTDSPFCLDLAENLTDAFRSCHEKKYDVVLMDLNLPDSSGLETISRFREKNQAVPLVVLTNINDKDFGVEAIRLGAQDYLLKGNIDEEILSRVIRYSIERKKILKQIRDDEERIRLFLKHVPMAVAVFDTDMRYIVTSQKWLDDYGFKAEDVAGKYHYDIFPDLSDKWRQLHQSCLSGNVEKNEQDLLVFPDGRKEWMRWEMCPWRRVNGDIGGIVIFREVITQRKYFEDQLLEYQQTLSQKVEERTKELKKLYTHLEDVREQERTNIARDVHDEFGQTLTAIKMDISWIKNHREMDRGVLETKIDNMISLINHTIKSVQRICSELRPGILDDLGLIAAIEWQVQTFQQRTGVACDLSIEPKDLEVDPKYATTIFRILQETLTNIARHAGATNVRVTVRQDGQTFILEVADNGKGIDQQELQRSDSFGLMGMKERAGFHAGKLTIEGELGKGTIVRLEIPLIYSEAAYD